jgi:hypothetical protein
MQSSLYPLFLSGVGRAATPTPGRRRSIFEVPATMRLVCFAKGEQYSSASVPACVRIHGYKTCARTCANAGRFEGAAPFSSCRSPRKAVRAEPASSSGCISAVVLGMIALPIAYQSIERLLHPIAIA